MGGGPGKSLISVCLQTQAVQFDPSLLGGGEGHARRYFQALLCLQCGCKQAGRGSGCLGRGTSPAPFGGSFPPRLQPVGARPGLARPGLLLVPPVPAGASSAEASSQACQQSAHERLDFRCRLLLLCVDKNEGSAGVGCWGPAAAWRWLPCPPWGFLSSATRLLQVLSPGSRREPLLGGRPPPRALVGAMSGGLQAMGPCSVAFGGCWLCLWSHLGDPHRGGLSCRSPRPGTRLPRLEIFSARKQGWESGI